MLKNREMKLDTIAKECGFCDKSHLWKVMKKKLNLAPADIRGKRVLPRMALS
jgi:transcriptional regulator GlxA family with amidase domain